MKDRHIDRLLRSAAQAAPGEVPAEIPLGFDTRVVAVWRSLAAKPNGIASLLRRVVLLSALVIAISTLAAVREIKQGQEQLNDLTNEFAIADTAIQDEFSE